MSPTGGLSVFQIHPTRRCNLACAHCYSSSGPAITESLRRADAINAIEDAAALGYRVLGVSGGEPLLYEPLREILTIAKSVGMTTTVTTNAMLLTPRWIEDLSDTVDLLAVSIDGTPEAHVAMRRHPNAFSAMERNVARLAGSGITFGFITTLTQHNVDQLDWIARFAVGVGAALLQIHPLETEGNARQLPADSIPDEIEMLYAAIETVRLRTAGNLRLQLDVNAKTELTSHPERYFATTIRRGALGSWLSPLVLEASGAVVPLTYGFDRRYQLGTITETRLFELAGRWNPEPFLDLARSVWVDLTSDSAPELCNWYEAMNAAARSSTAPRALSSS